MRLGAVTCELAGGIYASFMRSVQTIQFGLCYGVEQNIPVLHSQSINAVNTSLKYLLKSCIECAFRFREKSENAVIRGVIQLSLVENTEFRKYCRGS